MRIIVLLLALLCGALAAPALAGQPLVLATMNWPPFYGEDLPKNGFYAEISRRVFARAGYDMKLDFVPWNRAITLAMHGVYDGLLGAYYSDERAIEMIYTDEVAPSEEVFIQKRGRGIAYDGPESIRPFLVGVLRGGVQGQDLEALEINAVPAVDHVINLRKLYVGRIDLVLMGRQEFYSLVRESEYVRTREQDFEILRPPFKVYGLFNPISRRMPGAREVVAGFNKALEEMRADGTYDAILEEFGQKR
ncbi:substrate-binding periplasmic protein [Salidesulfovibrio onnuriiensis]|uniref:substrate-binding periplasmic protein n=1 Tax=Salidesulfovibrio onnuriiensis TaxID=2583823 RepID=UPI0011CAD342|nr:transporter substrate-binding domain-containing protein [Salidesulfovibrio onnuriiensis]